MVYLAQTKNYSTSYVGQRAQVTLVHDADVVGALRMLPIGVLRREGDVTTHRLWWPMGGFQHTTPMAFGILAPSSRSYHAIFDAKWRAATSATPRARLAIARRRMLTLREPT